MEEISFPRLSGTEEEKKVFKIILNKIKELGVEPFVQKFTFSTFYSRIYLKISVSVGFWVLLTFLININFIFTFYSLLITFILYFPLFLLTRKPEKIRIGKTLDSQNLWLKFNSYQPTDKNIFFMAHLDSKGQTITVRTRALSIFTYVISFISLVVILILRTFLLPLYMLITFIGFIPLLLNLVATLIFCLNRTNNKSKGVIDNASGVVCVLELLTHFTEVQKKVKNANIWFVLTGAEESGTMGIRYFHKELNRINTEKTYVNNFESLGKTVYIFITNGILENDETYAQFYRDTAKKYGFHTYISRLARGVHTDGMYLAGKDFNLFEYGSREVGKYMHSDYDSLENVDVSLMKEICEFNMELLEFFN